MTLRKICGLTDCFSKNTRKKIRNLRNLRISIWIASRRTLAMTKKEPELSKPTLLGKALRIAAIILFGLTVVFSLLAGIGTSCVALGAEKYASMRTLVPFKFLYLIFVVLTIAASLYGIRALIGLVKNRPAAFKEALWALFACLALAVAQVAASRLLRGKSMPNDMRVYISLITLVVFLVLRIPRIWSQAGIDGAGGDTGSLAAGASLFICGIAVLTVQWWAGPTHTFDGVNFADAWHVQLAVLGWGLVVGSLAPLRRIIRGRDRVEELPTAMG
jgi:hypothetical protein